MSLNDQDDSNTDEAEAMPEGILRVNDDCNGGKSSAQTQLDFIHQAA
jgi:hypothetical protein